jgi:hypothetical protein
MYVLYVVMYTHMLAFGYVAGSVGSAGELVGWVCYPRYIMYVHTASLPVGAF